MSTNSTSLPPSSFDFYTTGNRQKYPVFFTVEFSLCIFITFLIYVLSVVKMLCKNSPFPQQNTFARYAHCEFHGLWSGSHFALGILQRCCNFPRRHHPLPPFQIATATWQSSRNEKRTKWIERSWQSHALAPPCTCAVLESVFSWCQAQQDTAWISMAMDGSQVQVPGGEDVQLRVAKHG